jgi:hypothetical protein
MRMIWKILMGIGSDFNSCKVLSYDGVITSFHLLLLWYADACTIYKSACNEL